MSRKIDIVAAAQALKVFLEAVGAPVDDPELAQTGDRVARAFAEDLLSGYDMDPSSILSDVTTTNGSGLVVLTSIATTTTCPHHLMPATGVVHVGYIPAERVVGLGALARLVDCYALRLALQEDLGRNVVQALVRELGARAAGCAVALSPTCVTARGARRHGALAITHAFAGADANTAFQRQFFEALRQAEVSVPHGAV